MESKMESKMETHMESHMAHMAPQMETHIETPSLDIKYPDSIIISFNNNNYVYPNSGYILNFSTIYVDGNNSSTYTNGNGLWNSVDLNGTINLSITIPSNSCYGVILTTKNNNSFFNYFITKTINITQGSTFFGLQNELFSTFQVVPITTNIFSNLKNVINVNTFTSQNVPYTFYIGSPNFFVDIKGTPSVIVTSMGGYHYEYIDANNNRKLITTTDKYAVPLTNNSVTIHSVIPGPISYDNVVTIFSIISIVVLLILIIIFLRQYIKYRMNKK